VYFTLNSIFFSLSQNKLNSMADPDGKIDAKEQKEKKEK
jgi:hypothetical protein